MVKQSIHQEEIIIQNVSSPTADLYMKWKLTELKRKVDKSRSIIGDFNWSHSQWLIELVNKNNLGYRGTEQYYQPRGINQHL